MSKLYFYRYSHVYSNGSIAIRNNVHLFLVEPHVFLMSVLMSGREVLALIVTHIFTI